MLDSFFIRAIHAIRGSRFWLSGGTELSAGAAYPGWSPHDAVEAASTLRDHLGEQTAGQ